VNSNGALFDAADRFDHLFLKLEQGHLLLHDPV
jgi:hypothetical protein